ncbi:MAG: SusC/RagA family TonB-linked outer membrane protein [Saprospiraceae bacterium]|jgi:TonB-linked SusC/RagA family outer membrane protein|nr:SusC/RagA family TonB-linked outer membrane protein [Saprospiraceae bacterium]
MLKYKFNISLIFLLFLGFSSFAQEMTDIKKALRDIQDKYEVQFVYDDALVAGLKVGPYTNWDEKLDTKLDRILKPVKLTFSKISSQHYVIKASSLIEEKQDANTNVTPSKPVSNVKAKKETKITGIITDENDQPAIGVTVQVKTTGDGTITDFNGEYEIEIPENGVLIFSFIGYKTAEISVAGKSKIDLKLEVESTKIEEIVVVAYGVQKRAHLTGSVASLSSKELSQKPVDNLTTMLSGRLPGVITRQQSGVPGENQAKFFVRGRSSPTGSGAPLIIVDGVERPFDNLDPNEIESISILKDAASAAMYGVRAANGVVMITTKSGKESQKISLNFTSTYSISKNTAFPEYPDGVDYALWHNKARALDGQALDYSASDIDKIRNGDPDKILGNTQWTKMIFEPFAPQAYQNLNITGGNSKLRFFNNAAYLHQDGIIKGVSFDRINLRSNVEYEVNPNFNIALNIAGRVEERKQPGTSPGSQDITINNYKNIIFYSILARPTTLPNLPEGTALGWGNPIVARDQSGFYNQKRKIFQSTATFKYKIPGIDGLNVKANLSYDYENSLAKHFQVPQRLATWDYAKRELVYFDRLMSKDIASNKNELSQGFSDYHRITTQLSADYNKAFGKNTLNALVLFEEQSTKTSSFGVAAQDLPLASLPDLNFASQYITNSLYGSRGQRGTRGLVSRVGYIINDKYMTEFTGRADWSSRFAKGNRLGVFPAIALGWNISRENFFQPLTPVVSRLKLRASAGLLGNDDIGDFRFLKRFNLSGQPEVIFGDRSYLDLLTGAVPSYDITWEKTVTYNGGFEADIFDGMFSLEFDAFYKVTSDILQSIAGVFPPSVGGNFPSVVNAGKMEAKGFEAIVTHRKQVNKDFNYQISANVTLSRNKFLETDESPNVPPWQRRTGQPLGAVLGWVSDGLFQNAEEIASSALTTYEVKPGFIRYKDLNGDGVINFADRTWIGRSPIPEVIGGLNLSAGYKNLSVSAFFQGATRTDLMLTGEYLGAGFSDGTFFTQPFKWGANTPYFILENTWQKEGDQTEFPRLTTITPFNNNLSTDFWKRDASYLRLKTVEVSYSFNLKPNKYSGQTKLNVFFSGTNLWTLSRLKFIDPEAPTVNNGFYPQQKVYNFGINLSI